MRISLGIRKLVVLILVAAIFLLANAWLVVNWLQEKGLVEWAGHVKSQYLTGTAITIILVLLILLVKPGKEAVSRVGLLRRCPVCDHVLMGRGVYCSDCGSKVSN